MKKNELDLYVNTLWREGRRCYSDLREHEREIIASFVIQKSEFPWDHIAETKGNETVPAKLCAFLLERSDDAKSDLLDVLIKCAVNSVEIEVDMLFEEKQGSEDEAYKDMGIYSSCEVSETDLMISLHNSDVAQHLNNLNRRAY